MATKAEILEALKNPNVKKMLDVIAQSEGVKLGYNTGFGNEKIDDLSKHPNQKKSFTETTGNKNKTTAAGRYQFINPTWSRIADAYDLKDFSPRNQDIAAVALLSENGALPYVLKGDLKTAVSKSGGTWASFPTSRAPQNKRSWDEINKMIGGQIQNPDRTVSKNKINALIKEHERLVTQPQAKQVTPQQRQSRVNQLVSAFDKANPNRAAKPEGLPDFDATGNFVPEQPQQPEQPKPERSPGQQIVGGLEAAGTIGSSLIGAPIGQAVGTFRGAAQSLIDGEFGTPQGAQNILNAANQGAEALTYAPRTAAGQENVQGVGEFVQDVGLDKLPPAMGGLGVGAATLGRASAPVVAAGARDIAQAAKPVVAQAVEAAQAPIQATTNAIKSGVNSAAEAVGLREPQPAPNVGANVGAAQVDQATLREAMAADLPNKPELTLGQLTRDENQLSFEQNTARTPLGGDLRQRYADQHAAINNNLDIWLDEIDPVNVDRVAIGEGVDKALKTQMAADKKRVREAYERASESPEAQSIVDLNLKMKQDNDGNVAPVAPMVDDNLASLPPETRTTRPDGEIKTLQNGLGILHGTGDDALTLNDIDIIRQTGQKQGKAGRIYGGFYGAGKDRLAEAEGYANSQGGTPTVYEIRIKPQTKVLEKKGDVTRLSENYINDLKKDGIGLVVGKDPRGRTEYVVVDKDAISTLDKYDPNAAPSTDGLSVIDYLNTQPELPTAPIISAAKKTAESLGIARREADGTLTPLNPTVKQMEAWRQQINANTNMEAPNIRQASILKNYIDSHIEPATGKSYKAARMENKRFKDKWANNQIIKDLVGLKKGTDDRVIALENVRNKIVNGGSLADLRQVKRTLLTSGDDGKQAWKDIQAATLQEIKDKANNSIATNANGETVISPAALNKAINQLDQSGKLDYMFGESGANKLRSLNEVSKILFTVPPETAVNRSATALVLPMVIDTILATFAGLPAPIATSLRLATSHIKDSKIKAKVRKALNISERGNF
jgi:muramidase (phage lysozyme)